MKKLIQIVPFRSTNPDGVGDYARLIAEQLRSKHGYESVFIVANPDEGTGALNDGWQTVAMAQKNHAELAVALETARDGDSEAPILLHLSAYGFHNRGIPFWLVGAMAKIKREAPDARLITVFHELFATAAPWKSAFWLGWMQAWIARQVAQISDGALTTVGVYEDWLRPNMKPGADLVRAPVFSNMGEPTHIPPLGERPNRIALFGTNGFAERVYKTHADEAGAWIKAIGATSYIDIGARSAPPPEKLGEIVVEPKGRLSADAVSSALLQVRYAFLPYDITRLGKSGIFAALAAHGVVPICLGSAGKGADGLQSGSHFLSGIRSQSQLGVDTEQAARIQGNLIAWYRQHGLAYCCDCLAALIDGANAPLSDMATSC